MARVTISLPHNAYDILIEPGSMGEVGARVRALFPHSRCALIADAGVHGLHGERVEASLAAAGYRTAVATIPSGEDQKNLATIERLYQALLDERLERGSPIVAFGGGVTGDMAGFVAATYLRGVPYVQCPTTLLAMVDSSVGGKTGVNVPQGKNLIGAFYQPGLVLADPEVLRTLPERELRCGLAECIKHAVIRDPDLFQWIGSEMKAIRALESDALVELVRRNVEIKARVVTEDERERGVRAHLNFGHTYGHAIEATAGYGEILHGEAVALGMLAATRTAIEIGLCDAAVLERLVALLEAAGLETRAALAGDEELMVAMGHDKKVVGDRIRLVLPDELGHVVIRDDVPHECIEAGFAQIRA